MCSPRPWPHLCVWPHLAARRHGARRPEARGLPSTSLPFGLQARHLLDPLPPPPSLNLRTVSHHLRASGSAGMLQYHPTSAHDSHCARPSHVHGSRWHVLSWPLHSCVSGEPCTLSLQMWPLAAARTHPAVESLASLPSIPTRPPRPPGRPPSPEAEAGRVFTSTAAPGALPVLVLLVLEIATSRCMSVS